MNTGRVFRPHFKTHQSLGIGEWFRKQGVGKITVSSVRMATYFARGGWKDITIAVPANIHEANEINHLSEKIDVNILLEDPYVAAFFADRTAYETGYFIKIDTGFHRTGIDPGNFLLIDQVMEAALKSSKLTLRGFLTHAGHTYHAKSADEIRSIMKTSAKLMLALKKKYQQRFPGIILSYGDTPSCSLPEFTAEFDEYRPGNFVFYDVMQYALGSCLLTDIAVAVACPVISVHPSRKEAVIYGGSVHLSKDFCFLPPDSRPIFGLAADLNEDGEWDTARILGKVTRLTQEHGILELTQVGCNLRPGDWLAVLPAHSCLTASLFDEYLTTGGIKLEKMRW